MRGAKEAEQANSVLDKKWNKTVERSWPAVERTSGLISDTHTFELSFYQCD